jgi:ribonucleoside-diphosphate reductase alpha chain
MDNTELLEVNPIFESIAYRTGFHSDELMKRIAEHGSIQRLAEVPSDVRRVFVTSHDISPEWHIRIQAAFQKYTDNAVSKTVNFPRDATPKDVEKVFMLAYKLGCKGITVYRDGSREEQVLNIKTVNKAGMDEGIIRPLNPDYDGGCRTCTI